MKLLLLLFPLLILFILGCSQDQITKPEQVKFNNQWSSPYKVSGSFCNHLVNADSNYLFVLNKTEWAYFACENPESVLRKVKKHGANVIRVLLEGTPYFSNLGYDLWPWGGTRKEPDFTTFNEKYWVEVERRIKLAGEQGIGIDLVLYFTLRPGVKDVNAQKPFWEQVIKRLSKYSNIFAWEIMNEYIANESFQDSAGSYFKANDPFHHPVCSSDGTTEDALWPEKSWMDLAIVHTCTGQDGYDLENWYLNVARNTRQHGKPAINNETGREKRHKNDDPVNRRKQAWLFNNSGCFWTWHAWDGCEGINDTTYYFEGWQYLKPMRQFYESIPFWTLQPNYTVCSVREVDLVNTTMSTPDRRISIMYCCTKKTGKKVENLNAFVRIKDGTYNITFLAPSDLKVLGETIFESKGLRGESEILLPSFQDDIIVLIKEKGARQKSLIEGTL
jgi:hypothetical protein